MKVLHQLRSHLDQHGFGDIEVVHLHGEDPASTVPDHPLVGAVRRTAMNACGAAPQLLPNMAGTGPMYELCQRCGIGVVSSGVGNAKSRNQAPNGNICVADFVDGIKLIATVRNESAVG